MFIAALFTIANTQKQPKHPLIEEWIKMWYIYTMEYCSTIKNNEIGPFSVTWIYLEILIVSEVTPRKKEKQYMMSLIVKVFITLLSPTLCNPMDCSLCPWNSPGKNTGVDSHSLLQRIFLTQGSNSGLQHCRQILYCLSHQRSLICLICRILIIKKKKIQRNLPKNQKETQRLRK